jgi:RNA polymerase sigma-70 factor (ECF subfamily)
VNDEDELIQLALAGKSTAFETLVLRYQDRLYTAMISVVGSADEAEDVVQESFIQAYLKLDTFQRNSRFFTWLYRIATNESLTFLEKKKKRFFFSIDDHQEKMENYLDHSPSLSGEEIEVKLQKSLLKLPDKQRLVFHLKYEEDLSYEEIAQITGTSIGALKASYHHAVKKIEQALLQE